jgi:hypothetical protein
LGSNLLMSCVKGSARSADSSGTRSALRIDTHQHFWTYSTEHYSWIDPTASLEERSRRMGCEQ